MDQPQNQSLHVAILPSPGMGHVIPMVELAKRLVGNHNFTVTFVVPNAGPPSTAMRSVFTGLPDSIHLEFLPPVNFDDLPEGSKIEMQIALTVVRSLASIRHALESLVSRRVGLVALVVDHFGLDAFGVARDLNLSSYLFYPSAATALSVILHLRELDKTTSLDYWELPDPVKIPGSFPIPGKDLPDPILDRKSDVYKLTLKKSTQYRLADGIIVNTFNDLERGVISSLQKRETSEQLPRVYPVGPLVKMERTTLVEEESNCLTWLDGQARGSVLFVSFGSGGTLSSRQINELALGLEKSEQRFLWVVRPPNDKAANAAYFKVNRQNESSFDFLPEGFLSRTRDRGLVVASWAPQAQILSHDSTGGFLTHCGWNSILESLVNGVPLIVWPLFAEQRMNAFLLTEDIKVALRPTAGESGFVEKEQIARVVKALMEEEGEEREKLRKRMEKLKAAAAAALSEDGNSTKALAEVAYVWKSQIGN